jgi:hypothetical protein
VDRSGRTLYKLRPFRQDVISVDKAFDINILRKAAIRMAALFISMNILQSD